MFQLQILTYAINTTNQANQKNTLCTNVKDVLHKIIAVLSRENSFWILTISLSTKASPSWHGEKEIASHHVLYVCR